MKRWVASCLLALAAGSVASAAEHGGAPDLTCKVDGYDVILVNPGPDPVPEGSETGWSVPFARSEGRHIASRDIAPGGIVVLTGALGSSYLTPDVECIVIP